MPGGDAEVVTLLFTDIESSTRLWDQDADRMRPALARHDALLRDAVESHGGTVVKMMGDGAQAAFNDPLGAVRAALQLQQALANPEATAGVALRVRCGLHVGMAERRDGDYFGAAVNRAARIMGAAHGGQILLSEPVAAMVRDRLPTAATLRDLGKVRLRGIASPEQVFQLEHPSLRTAFPALSALAGTPNNLPLQTTTFVGRATEQAEILRLLTQQRMVTLTGPGGVGKTRIALQVGAELLSAHRDGVWFVDLAPLADARLVAEAAAAVFGLPLGSGGSPIAALVTFLKERKTLLILDNCEHLIAACAELADAIVRGCPGVSVMASSREALAVPGEHVYAIEPLATPDRAEAPTAATAQRNAAVRLFLDRACAANAGFALTDGNAATVVEICRRLDGIPLAIELAAPRARMLTPEQILSRLDERFVLLTGGARTALARQQTLRATLDWSYDLLSASERALLARLSVFAASFTIDAATDVVCGEPVDGGALFDTLSSLVDKSLVSVDLARAEPRYRLLESTRDYAREKLDEVDARARRRRHAEYLTRFFDRADQAWPTAPTGAWLETCEPELENLRAALEWSFGPDGDPAEGVTLFASTGPYWIQLSLQAEFRRWRRLAVANVSERHPPRIAGRIWLLDAQGGSPGDPVYIESAERAVQLARAAGEPDLLGRSLTHAAYLRRPHDIAAAESHLAEAESVLRPCGRSKSLASLLNVRGGSFQLVGDVEASRRCYAESIAIAHELGDWLGYAAPSFNRVDDDFNAGRVDAAIVEARRLIDQCREHRGLGLLGLMLFYYGDYLLAADRHAEARAVGIEGIRLNRSLGRNAPVNACIETVALAMALDGERERAARLAGYVEAFYAGVSFVRGPTQQRTWDRLIAVLHDALDARDAERLMAEGASWTEERAIDAATNEPRGPLHRGPPVSS
jgi:predicted ATPase/class 3 adenylate cyclase